MGISPSLTHPPSRLCLSDLRHSVPCKCRALTICAASPRGAASYPLPVRQASALPSGFLQIRSYPRHPCRSANSSPCRASRGLSPPSRCALPGTPTKTATRRWPLPSPKLKQDQLVPVRQIVGRYFSATVPPQVQVTLPGVAKPGARVNVWALIARLARCGAVLE